MAGDIKFRNIQSFNKALSRVLSETKKSAEDEIKVQAKGLVRNLILLTPPHSGSEKSGEAKKIGVTAVTSDISKVLQGVPVKQADTSASEIPGIHKRNRTKGGVLGVKHVGRAKVPKTALNTYIKGQKDKVGRLAAGWNKSARDLGIKPPAWIAQHNTPSGHKMKITEKGLYIKMSNRSAYAQNIFNLKSRVNRAVDRQGKAMRMRSAKFAHVAAKRAGFKAGRGM